VAPASVISVTCPTVFHLDIFEARIDDGVRENAQSWRDLLLDLGRRGFDPRASSRATPV
jgi:hypothetical protein